ncbi:carbonic anhydrase family protein [Actinocrispum sp. NPDC049592]|uniref:carbonic anhydrase family protein n=1 Tax=Actinocrispum sp. NPDC049592 TaxID=3154835 RepID=UPI00343C60FA
MVKRGAIAILVPLSLATTVLAAPAAETQLPHQSPINITRENVRVDPNLPQLRISYRTTDVELEYIRKDQTDPAGCATRNHEETEEGIVPAGAGYVTLSGTRYDLIQFHFHTPSEHRFEGQSTPLELHLVHRSAAGRLLVIGVPLIPGPRSAVDKVLAKLAPECGESVHLPKVDLNELLPPDRRTVARYDGSLTTAPFSEDVQWFLTGPKTVSPGTVARFQSLFTSGNAREVQPLNGRVVELDRPRY